MFARINRHLATRLHSLAQRYPRIARYLGFARQRRGPLVTLFVITAHVVGFSHSMSAIKDTRTPQGAIAWAISLNTFPYVAVPAYWIFGHDDFDSYISARSAGIDEVRPLAETLIAEIKEVALPPSDSNDLMQTLGNLSSLPVTTGNHADLLIDGEETFRAIFEAIDSAEKYILLQSYIIRADTLGTRLKQRLIEKAEAGVKVYVLYDDYGSFDLDEAFAADLEAAGARVNSFMNLEGKANRFQLNFRNHRKIAVIDGKTAFIGGHNFGDEYLGEHEVLTPWRDSHMRLTGPVVTCVQLPFVEDWRWATGEIPPDLDWDIVSPDDAPGEMHAVCIPSGPADPVETCAMFYQAAIHAAKERIWITTPYFVPDNAIVQALQLASIRGVDVKILIPQLNDSQLVHYSSFSYLEEMETTGVEVWRFNDGFLHQKVMLIDDDVTAIGSSNLDNRSFRLNFEVNVAIKDTGFASEVEAMLTRDFKNSHQTGAEVLERKSEFFKLKVRVARLLAPIQ